MEQRTWRERDGSSSCKCVRWGNWCQSKYHTPDSVGISELGFIYFTRVVCLCGLHILFMVDTGGHSFLCLFNPIPLMEKYISLDLNMSIVIESQN